MPWDSVSEDGVEDGEQFAHGGDEGEFLGSAGGDEALVDGLDLVVVSAGGEGRHVQDVADGDAAAGDHAPATEAAAVAVDWCDADQCGDASAVEGSQFRQLGEQSSGGGGADPGNALQQVFLAMTLS